MADAQSAVSGVKDPENKTKKDNKHWINEKVENEINFVESVVKSYRSLREEMPANERNERRPAFAHCKTEEIAETIKVLGENDDPPAGCSVSIVNENLSVYLMLQVNINLEAQLEKLKKKSANILKQFESPDKMMSDSGNHNNPPRHVLKENEAELYRQLEVTQRHICLIRNYLLEENSL